MAIRKPINAAVLFSLLGTLYGPTAIAETTIPMDIEIGGFIRADLGFGDRYGDAAGEDRIAVSKAALSATATSGNVKGIFVLGTEISSEPIVGTNDGNIDIKDAFIVWGDDSFNLSVGAQPLLFGLKSAGYPGDHSIQASVEFGGGGAIPVANQAGASALFNWSFGGSSSLRFGVFDNRGYTPDGSVFDAEDGSTVADNFMIQWRVDDLGGSGIYAVIGTENVYLGGDNNDTGSISTVGLGWKNAFIDISAEYFIFEDTVLGVPDEEEEYLIAELAFTPNEMWKIYLDYSEADLIEVKTSIVGLNYNYSSALMVTFEGSTEDYGGSDVSSVDFRLTLSY